MLFHNRHQYLKMNIFTAILVFGVVGIVWGEGIVKERCPIGIEQKARDYAYVSYASAGAPLGRLLLIRKGKDVCAIRFTEFHRGHDGKTPTLYNSGEETQFAEYDWFYQGDGSGNFTKKNVTSGHEKLARKPQLGVGRIAYRINGNTKVKCGPFKLDWSFPNGVAFYPGATPGDYNIELAPTKWRDVSEIKVNFEYLQWYHYDKDEKRVEVDIPIEELW